jgi:hypothetical protein
MGKLTAMKTTTATQSPHAEGAAPEAAHLGSRMAFEDQRPDTSVRGLLPTPPAVEAAAGSSMT